MKKTLLFTLGILFFARMASAQQGAVKLISVNFQQASIADLVNTIESKTSYHFYYDPAQFDSLKVTMQVTDKPLGAILDMAFANTAFHYAITPQQQVFLTKGRQVVTSLAPGFSTGTPASTARQASTVADYTDESDKKVADATTENKLYEIGIRTNTIRSGNATLSGYIRNIKSGEAVAGASIYVASTKSGV